MTIVPSLRSCAFGFLEWLKTVLLLLTSQLLFFPFPSAETGHYTVNIQGVQLQPIWSINLAFFLYPVASQHIFRSGITRTRGRNTGCCWSFPTLSYKGLAGVQEDFTALDNHPFNSQIFPNVFSLTYFVMHYPTEREKSQPNTNCCDMPSAFPHVCQMDQRKQAMNAKQHTILILFSEYLTPFCENKLEKGILFFLSW